MKPKVKILTVGKPEKWAYPAVEHWKKRIQTLGDVEIISLRSDTKKLDDIVKSPAEFPIALTRNGKMLTSPQWAEMLEEFAIVGIVPIFLIGDAEGLPAKIIAQCKRRISLSPATFQHDVALIVLLEQIYRALTIMAKLPYHRGE